MMSSLRNGPRSFVRLAGQLRRREGRDTAGLLRRMGLPMMRSIDATRCLKIGSNPLDYLSRRAASQPQQFPFEADLAREHFARVPDGSFPGAAEIAKHCAAIFEAKRETITANYRPPYGEVIRVSPGENGSVIDNPEDVRPIVEFFAQPEVFGAISRYLGERPVLSTVSLLYTEPNNAIKDSQAFHRDMQDRNLLHLLMPIWPVDLDGGPFTLLPAGASDKVIRAVGDDVVRITDEQIFSVVDETALVRITGEPGDIYLCNPFRCIHFGARAKTKSRLILIVNLSSAFEGVEGMQSVYRAQNRRVLDDGRPETRWLLNL